MNVKRRVAAKLATLDGAKAIYSIMIGLAVRESLTQVFPGFGKPPVLSFTASVIVFAYLCTVTRYSHGIFLLIGLTGQRINEAGLPVSRRVAFHYVLILSIGTCLAIMAETIPVNGLCNLSSYILSTSFLAMVGLVHYMRSGVVREPLRRGKLVRLWRDTTLGYSARAEVNWMALGVVVLFACVALHPATTFFAVSPECAAMLFSGILIAVTVLDYVGNRSFFFGGSVDLPRRKMVYVCSPLRLGTNGTEEELRRNIERAQHYCHEILKYDNLQPFAPHAFYSYLLHSERDEDHTLMEECAWAFIDACDLMYLYWNHLDAQWGMPIRSRKALPPQQGSEIGGMMAVWDRAKQMGVAVEYGRVHDPEPSPGKWLRPEWAPPQYGASIPKVPSARGARTDAVRKRVYVCSPFRGNLKVFNGLSDRKKIEMMRANIRRALWYCYNLLVGTEFVAPFASTAFYSYFDADLQSGNVGPIVHERLLERAISVLQMCDAVYVYTNDGLPSHASLSEGMSRVIRNAEALGIEVQYRVATTPEAAFVPTLPKFGGA